MDMPLVTCCILSYKNFTNIYSTVSSILEQDYPNIELGVFDDGSENFPNDELHDYIEKNKGSNIKKVILNSNKVNLGTVKNINNAIRMTTGEFFILLPSDDRFYDSSSCSKIIDYFLNSGADIVTSFREVIGNENEHINYVPSHYSAERIKNSDAFLQFKWIAEGAPICGAGTYYSRRILEKYNGFDEEYVLQEDGPFFLRATREGTKIHFLDDVTYKYLIGNGVSSGNNNNPLLVKDVQNLFKIEIDPYLSQFDLFEKRRIQYEKQRIKMNKKLRYFDKILLFLKYPDVLIYRRKNAH